MKKLVKLIFLSAGFFACKQDNDRLFRLVSAEESGIAFENNLTFSEKFNVYTYRNYYNGGGVSIGDINNDGLVDIYFTANQSKNKLYLNLGNFQFKDITKEAGVGGNRAWSTGVTMVDVNGDGWLDIYVCNSGDVEGDNKQNELFINNQDLTFVESAAAYNLDDKGFSTHASFFDYDKDGDLDVYLLNNSYQAIGSFNLRRNERPKRDKLGGDKLMMNTGQSFEDISESAGIYGSVIGFGLGVTVGDVNGDSWDDIYVSNDFFERDYLYVNQQDGTFKECLTEQMKSISGASMGADMADINNDGYNDIFVTEMLPYKNSRLKSVTTFEDWNRYQYSVQNGYFHQFTRNTFQLNNGNSSFSEIGRLSGVDASDWSWGALIFDMENDGLKDIFVANGIYQDLTDQDYLQYISNEEVVKSIVSNNKVDYKRLIEIIPSNKIENHAYKNTGNLNFELLTNEYGLDAPGFSNGAAYGDFDNDGDLDLVVNNVNMPAFIYENTASKRAGSNYIKLVLRGRKPNSFAIGAKIKVRSGDDAYYVEQQPARGFQSSVDLRPNIGLKSSDNVDITIVWPTGKKSFLTGVQVNQTITIEEGISSGMENEIAPVMSEQLFRKSRKSVAFKHQENDFVDFDRDRLLYHMKSTEGPKMAVGDVNLDGIEDLYIGGAKGIPGTLLIGTEEGYNKIAQPAFEKDQVSEDSQSLFFDADGDGDLDLYVCSGGVEFSQTSSALVDRLYFNDGSGVFTRSGQGLPSTAGYVSSATAAASDVDGDGDLDLFVGERVKLLRYGISCSGFLLQNDGRGEFTDVTDQFAPELLNIGMLTDGTFSDFDKDGDDDLLVTGEFMGLELFENNQGKFTRVSGQVGDVKGWWNVIHTADLDGDGDEDIIAGNHGLNSRFKASKDQPIVLYLNDFDENSFLDAILTGYAEDGKLYPYALRHNLIDQIRSLKKKFPDYQSYKNATVSDIFGAEALANSNVLQVNTLKTLVFVNNGNFEFTLLNLPVEAQLSPVYAISTSDYDRDGDLDILLGGNLYGTKPEVGRYDASFGAYLENTGDNTFMYQKNGKGFSLNGEIRDILSLKDQVIVSRNNDSLVLFEY